MTATVKLSSMKPHPKNPRFIRDASFELLKASIIEDIAMLEGRGILLQKSSRYIIGGDKRWRALKERTQDPEFRAAIGTDKPGEIPAEWVTVLDVDDAAAARIMIKDNAHYGEFDWDMVANNWDVPELEAWGLDLPDVELGGDDEDNGDEKEESEMPSLYRVVIDCESEAQMESVLKEMNERGIKCQSLIF